MKSKTLIGGLIAGVVSFLLGWLVFGILLKTYYDSNTTHYEGLYKAEPTIWALIIANLAWGLLTAYILDLAGINSMKKGFIVGFIVFLLVTFGFDMFNVGLMHLIKIQLALVDTLMNAVFGGIIGGLVGWWYSRGSNAAA